MKEKVVGRLGWIETIQPINLANPVHPAHSRAEKKSRRRSLEFSAQDAHDVCQQASLDGHVHPTTMRPRLSLCRLLSSAARGPCVAAHQDADAAPP